MDLYVAVRSEHGKPAEVTLFGSEAAAREYARKLSKDESWEDKSEEEDDHDHEDEDHDHHYDWLEDWGDDDGCGVIVGPASAP